MSMRSQVDGSVSFDVLMRLVAMHVSVGDPAPFYDFNT